MSLKGDVWTIRNGRCTSEISVFNYPEHLNPFYEEDNHKRLRFWKINKSNEGRRRSFSLVGLKDIWGFKSLTFKKKSSTLGINKTSESPPMLRKTINLTFSTSHDFLNTSGKQCRFSADGTVKQNRILERNGMYRNSSTHINQPQNYSKTDTAFQRNTPHRSTYQMGDTLSVIQRNNKEFLNNTMSRGTSISSCDSTNPFECNEEEVYDNSTQKTKRKKYRAPAPPVKNIPVPTCVAIATDKSGSFDHEEIVNLTAEIVDFVENSKYVNRDSDSTDNVISNAIKSRTENNEIHASVELDNDAIARVGKIECINIHEYKISTIPRKKLTSFQSNSPKTVSGKTKFVLNKENINSSTIHHNGVPLLEKLDKTKTKSSQSDDESENNENACTQENGGVVTNKYNNLIIDEDGIGAKTSIKDDKSNDYTSEPLKIIESTEDILVQPNVEQYSQTTKINEFSDGSYSPPDLWRKSSLAPLQSNIPPEKRRSVQEIIESINRNQRLLSCSKISTDVNENNAINAENSTHENNCFLKSFKINNNDLLVKNRIHEPPESRESSPTTSNLDWNPVPKPKRTKNLYDI